MDEQTVQDSGLRGLALIAARGIVFVQDMNCLAHVFGVYSQF